MNVRIIACLLMVLVPAVPLSAEFGIDAQGQAVEKLEQAYAVLQDMQAVFKQETGSGIVSVIQQASGRVYFKKTGRMFWKYETPEEQHIILDGSTLWIYLPAEKQAMKNNFTLIPQHIVVDLFRGRMDIRENFTVRSVEREDGEAPGYVVFDLEPIEPTPTVSRLILWVDPADYLVRRSTLHDAFGNRTDVIFDDISIDQGLPDTLFTFTPPRGVAVFEPPQL